MLRLVCFDLGGVLVRIVRSWPEACERAGLPVRDLPCDNGVLESWSLRLHAGEVDIGEYCAGLSAALAEVYSAAEIAEVHEAWVTGDYEGVAGVVEEVRAAGVQTALLSNTNAAHFDTLVDGPAVRLLDHLVVSYEIGLLKPDEAIYAHVEAQTGVAAPAIGFFDDTPVNVAAARARGWSAEHIDYGQPTAPQMRAALSRWEVLTD